jgi:Holliday junction DNA helicase RuvA
MIARLKGALIEVAAEKAVVEAGPIAYEVLIPAYLATELRPAATRQESVTFHILHYVEAAPTGGMQKPRLVGFASASDRACFDLLLGVPGLGVRKVLAALVAPLDEVARAIEGEDMAALASLPGIGRRMAEKMTAELRGKLAPFALAAAAAPGVEELPPDAAAEALAILSQLDYSPQEAHRLIAEALRADPALESADAIVRWILQRRGVPATTVAPPGQER